MNLLKIILCTLALSSSLTLASTSPECLKHLGGATADVQYYNGLTNDILSENLILSRKIEASIPENNKNRKLLNQFSNNQKSAKKYCVLIKESSTKWLIEKKPVNPQFYVYDVEYYECLFNIQEQANLFLKKIIQNITTR